ncbi:CRISPR-associated endonuclease Cas1 [Nodularia sphaerocarpa]|uniref:CRISPR-associated endonuclease Cas1 n=1 Tax=Nodularia sphaerocarpa TaxID=137816 RepID=UPI001EFBCAB5|nr:CRISPR-associated endonuclease Cas1 [Nodularia sphaerocarpa]MDB9373230.1 CRISPR-associated endonuclease Cas1 [Nodularia sphaerocarpa CS-585]MDB9376610.1 CRISPR-associated endonuclease Cas1 [Nodularia sphaerocarpa CS-585A2]ULP73836.1 CRISPR-associated endonuclease Cas1 [Nodularia sphaerocarpa UHCC 0038]
MRTLYVSRQGCYITLKGETLIIKQGETIHGEVQLPHLEQILVFGKSQITTQAIRTCLWRDIPIAYLSRMGHCYGRLIPIARGYRQLSRYQQQLTDIDNLLVARNIVQGKLKNSRTFLQRQQRRNPSSTAEMAIKSLEVLRQKAAEAETIERLMGLEGAGAAQYFSAFGECLNNPDFVFLARSRRPPGNPVNAMLSFGYQILWNHLLTIIELQGLDPYYACLHQGTQRHAALASDLIEEFRAPMIDSLVLWLVNSKIMKIAEDFEYHDSGCYLNNYGRPKYIKYFLQRLEEEVQNAQGEKQPRWDLITQQIKSFKNFVYHPSQLYQPYQIR